MRLITPSISMVLLVCLAYSAVAYASQLEKEIDVELSEKRWTTLALLRSRRPNAQPIPAKMPLKSVSELEFVGSMSGNPHLLNEYRVDGAFVIQNGFLVPQREKSALLQLPTADSFELEGIIGLQGEGGWLMLFGWDVEQSTGYCLYHSQLRSPDGPWRLCRIEDGKAVEGSEVLLHKENVNGTGPLEMRVDDGVCQLKILETKIMQDCKLSDYSPGAILIGTFKPRYGPKKIGIRSLRMKGW